MKKIATTGFFACFSMLSFSQQNTVSSGGEAIGSGGTVSYSVGQIDYTNSPEVVSSDFVGSRTACIYDAQATIVNGNHCVLYCWYDNEFGYTKQVIRLAKYVAKVRRNIYY